MRLHRLPALLLAASLSVSGVLTTAACGSGTAHATDGATVSAQAPAHAQASQVAGPASSSPRRTSSTPAIASGRAFLVNSKADAADMAAVRAAITKAGGGFVTSWPQIGVTVGVAAVGKAQAVVKTLRKDAHVQSVGATGTLVAREKNRAPISTAKKSTLKEQDLITKAAQSPSANKIATGKGVTIGIATPASSRSPTSSPAASTPSAPAHAPSAASSTPARSSGAPRPRPPRPPTGPPSRRWPPVRPTAWACGASPPRPRSSRSASSTGRATSTPRPPSAPS